MTQTRNHFPAAANRFNKSISDKAGRWRRVSNEQADPDTGWPSQPTDAPIFTVLGVV